MAARKKGIDIMSIVSYTGGGVVGGLLIGIGQKQIFKKNPAMAPLLPVAGGALLQFLGNDRMKEIGGVMIAVGAAAGAQKLLEKAGLNGLSRVSPVQSINGTEGAIQKELMHLAADVASNDATLAHALEVEDSDQMSTVH